MGSNPHKYSATLDTPFPAVINLCAWSGSLIDLFNDIPSSTYNDVVYPILKTQMAISGYDLQSVTNSHWINDNGKLAFYFNFVADPPTAEEAAGVVAAIAGILVGILVSTLTSWSTVVAAVLGLLAAVATFAFIQVFVIDQGPLYTTPPSSGYTPPGTVPSGGSCRPSWRSGSEKQAEVLSSLRSLRLAVMTECIAQKLNSGHMRAYDCFFERG